MPWFLYIYIKCDHHWSSWCCGHHVNSGLLYNLSLQSQLTLSKCIWAGIDYGTHTCSQYRTSPNSKTSICIPAVIQKYQLGKNEQNIFTCHLNNHNIYVHQYAVRIYILW